MNIDPSKNQMQHGRSRVVYAVMNGSSLRHRCAVDFLLSELKQEMGKLSATRKTDLRVMNIYA